MTKGVGYDKYWDSGGGMHSSLTGVHIISSKLICLSIAVHPSEAAVSTLDFLDNFSIKDTGSFWAPRGPRYVLYIPCMDTINLLGLILILLTVTLEKLSVYLEKIYLLHSDFLGDSSHVK